MTRARNPVDGAIRARWAREQQIQQQRVDHLRGLRSTPDDARHRELDPETLEPEVDDAADAE